MFKQIFLIVLIILIIYVIWHSYTHIYEDSNNQNKLGKYIDEYVVQNTPIKKYSEKIKNFYPEKEYRYENIVTLGANEGVCRRTLEAIFHRPFPTKRPSFLKNPETGRSLELDCYNEGLKLALEYNGAQHYEYPNTFHKTKKEFSYQVRRDNYKKDLCKQNGILLLIVPHTISKKEIPHYIQNKLKMSGYKL